jgi:hypothetical protein
MRAVSPYVDGLPLVTGSFAVEWNIRERGGRVRPRQLNDIDLVVVEASEIEPDISHKFLIHHFHPTREKGNVLMQLVEPRTRTRVDIFTARSASVVERASRTRYKETELAVVSAEDLAARLLAIIVIVLDGRTVDPKYVDSFSRSFEVADRDAASKLWQEYRWGNYTDEFLPTADEVVKLIRRRQDLLKTVEYSHDVDAKCQWCVEADEFPLADRREVFRLLGYV